MISTIASYYDIRAFIQQLEFEYRIGCTLGKCYARLLNDWY